MSETGPWLVAIDMQVVFGDPTSQWCAPRYADAATGVERLLPHFAGRTVFTKFVAPERPERRWREYYADWPFALQPPNNPLWDLTSPFDAVDAPQVSATTFGKWSQLRDVVDPDAGIVLAGVSTDCCVLSTALAAADDGVWVRVVADACAGVSDDDHQRALDIMALYGPLIEVTSVDSVLRDLG